MIKKRMSIGLIILFSLILGLFIYEKIERKQASVSEKTAANTNEVENVSLSILGSQNFIKSQLTEGQIRSLNEIVEMKSDNGEQIEKINIKSANISKQLPDNIKVSEQVRKKIGEDVMDADGTFLKDFYYLKLHVQHTATTGKQNTILPSSLKYCLGDDESNIYINDGGILYKGISVNEDAYYATETDGLEYITFDNKPILVEAGTACEYDAILILPEECIEKYNIYIYDYVGTNIKHGIINKEAKYIKVLDKGGSD